MELLSPAGDMTCLRTAIKYGADAVYCGLKEFSMRKTAKNFTRDELKEAVKYVHDNDKKIYLCLNTVIYEDELDKAIDIINFAHSIDIDALILSDISLMEYANSLGIDVHASVQCNITNSNLAKFYSRYCKRIVLSRELTLNQIKIIKENLKRDGVNLELEGFVHGALCVAISGRCFLSAYLFNKHANCGECLQPCRRKWKLINEHHDGTYEILCEGKFLLSPKDLCMIEHIPELIGVLDAFKIEGRAKNADYVMRVTKVYREAIDSYFDGSYYDKLEYFKKELSKVYNRGYDTGFYFRDVSNKIDFQYDREGNISEYKKVEIGRVVNFYKKINVAEIELYHDLKVGDVILIMGKTTGCVEEKVDSMEINHKKVKIAKKGERVGVKLNNLVREGDKVYLLKKLS
ncbi:collagenase PrtC [Methanocaldococcus villosus KIN24-T80]|uniref:Collagenase PrtC n=1 Tax=Methanocaldococcus villosus KIN24-T80 TaxID=1069083 RepID=N6V2P4_9EURY|nr:U32 family peptidase [Methanocaldococcus villosus]ENN96523.1 collagenase PrtC [Methanocaldococcus villosus KIN24-T80]